jgi:hypothetical protein
VIAERVITVPPVGERKFPGAEAGHLK